MMKANLKPLMQLETKSRYPTPISITSHLSTHEHQQYPIPPYISYGGSRVLYMRFVIDSAEAIFVSIFVDPSASSTTLSTPSLLRSRFD
jgi:hypothetical protein